MRNLSVVVLVVVAIGVAVFVGMQAFEPPTEEVPAVPAPVERVPVEAPPVETPLVEEITVEEIPVEPVPDAAEPVEAAPAAPEDAAAADVPAEGALNAETLVGTEWQVGMFTLAFKEGGVVVATMGDSETQGTWSVEGDTLSVTGGGNTVTATIVGDQLMAGDTPLPRIK